MLRMTRLPARSLALLFATTACAGLMPVSASAQTTVNGRAVYEAAFFTSFAPATAADMVARVPGFSIDDGENAVRGFSQAAGNVLINGQRPASKSDRPSAVLARIPAAHVVRIEIAPGAHFGSDYAAKAQVANVIVTGGSLSGLAKASLTRTYTGRIMPGGRLSLTATRGPSTFTGEISNYYNNVPEEGSDTLTARPGGALIEYQRKRNDHFGPGIVGTLGWDYNDGDHRTAHLNAKADFNRYRLIQRADVRRGDGATREDLFTDRSRERSFELGGDVTRPLLGGGIKLVALATREHYWEDQLYRRDIDAPGRLSRQHFYYLSDSAETLGRISWTRGKFHGWAVEAGMEGALNSLAISSLYRTAAPGQPFEAGEADAARVEEKRGEIFVSAGRQFTPKLRGDFTLAQEFSRLAVTKSGADNAAATRTLSFTKPKASLDWRPGDGWLLRLSAARTVAQLDFMDFVSTLALASNQGNAGNARLEPQRAWEFGASAEHPILGDGLARVELGYRAVEKVQDRIPVGPGRDAPGNLGSGRIYIAKSALDVPLTRLGLKGGRISANASIWDTHVRDPYTGQDRPFSSYSLASIGVEIRQDIGRWSWSVDLQANSPSTTYRLAETDRYYGSFNNSSLLVTYRPNPVTTIDFKIVNFLNVPARRWRTFYDPDRSAAAPYAHEYRERNFHWLPSLSVKRTF